MLKYRGTYRVVHEVDRRTMKPTDNPDDTYIYCANGGQIYRYSKDILVYEREGCNGNYLYQKIIAAGVKVTDHWTGESSVRIYFGEEYLDILAKIVQARTLGANINPKSKRNLRLFGLQ